MTMSQANREEAIRKIRDRMPFAATVAFCGRNGGVLPDGHRLPEPHLDAYRTLLRNNDVAYTVFSYATPIAWETRYGEIVIPDVRYSETTSHHQAVARQGFARPQ